MVTARNIDREPISPIRLVSQHQDYLPLRQMPGTWYFALWPKEGLSNHNFFIGSGSTNIIKPIEPMVRPNHRLPQDILNLIRQAEQSGRFDVCLLATPTRALFKPAGRLDEKLLVVGFARTEPKQPVQLGQRDYPILSDILPRLFINGGDGLIISPVQAPNLRIVGEDLTRSR